MVAKQSDLLLLLTQLGLQVYAGFQVGAATEAMEVWFYQWHDTTEVGPFPSANAALQAALHLRCMQVAA